MADIRTADQLRDLRRMLTINGDVSVAIAYVNSSGLKLIESQLQKALNNERRRIRFLIGMDIGGFTRPDAVNSLLSRKLRHKNFEVRAFISRSNETFHPKLFISESDRGIAFLSGSYNLTEAALQRNPEHGLRVNCNEDEPVGKEVLEAFSRLWRDPRTRELTPDLAKWYERNYPKDEPGSGNDISEPPPPDSEDVQRLPRWPSLTLAYFMGVVHARGRFEVEKSRIKVNLSFRTWGTFAAGGAHHTNDSQSQEVRKRIVQEVRDCFPSVIEYGSLGEAQKGRIFEPETVRVFPSRKRVIYVDFSYAPRTFSRLLNSFDQASAASPPVGIAETGRSISKKFLQGYCLASGTIDDEHSSEVCLRLLTKGIGDPARDLIGNKTGVNAEIKNRGGAEHIALPIQDFQKSIGFDDEWLDGLVARIVSNSLANVPEQSGRRNRRPTSQSAIRT